MFAIRRCSQKTSALYNFIYTSTALRCDKFKGPEKVEKNTTSEEKKKKGENVKSDPTQTQELLKSVLEDFQLKSVDNKKEINIPAPQGNQGNRRKKEFEKQLANSVETVASSLGGDVEKTKADLFKSIETFSTFKEKKQKRKKKKSEEAPGKEKQVISKKNKQMHKDISVNVENVPNKMDNSETRETKVHEKPFTVVYRKLRIFNAKNFKPVENELKLWRRIQENELKFTAKAPPRNYYDELIQWTEEGKVWHFPIDNDQGREEEAAVHFTEHVFLEEHLEPWCPKSGPLRHFMELVIVGISKNHTFTVQDKLDHIYWYKDYFEKKRNLLTEVGAFTSVNQIQDSKDSSSTQ